MAVAFKKSVRVEEFTQALAWMLYILEQVSRIHPSFPNPIVVTSIDDGKHSTNSKHYKGEALDIRTHNFEDTMSKRVFMNTYLRELNKHPEAAETDKFIILHESIGTPNEHFHVQVKKGMTYGVASKTSKD